MKRVLVFLVPLVLSYSCQKDENASNDNDVGRLLPSIEGLNLPEVPFNYANPNLPNFYNDRDITREDNTPNNNPVTNEGATLGRVLFYDTQLSLNNSISCASCHSQENGFSDPDRFSRGFLNGQTHRQSMGLANSTYYDNGNFFWDERASSLEEQVLMPIQDQIEMGLTLDTLVNRLQNSNYYPALFTYAFGDNEISSNRVSLALSQFIRSMISYRSKYDLGRTQVNNENQNFPNFTNSENRGKGLFFSNRLNCDACHGSDAFIAPGPRNNGPDLTTIDAGVGGITGDNDEIAEFKVGSLKNIALTAPYMHDGRFATLMQVIDFYNNEVQNHPNLSGQMRNNGQIRRLNLSDTEKSDLLAFLHTLTDDGMITDEKFSDPFID